MNNAAISALKTFTSCLLIIQLCFCKPSNDREKICQQKLNEASSLASKNSTNDDSLVAALNILNKIKSCKLIAKTAADLKIRIFIQLNEFEKGILFVDSLDLSHFEYPYKKKLIHDNFLALQYSNKNDTLNRDKTYQLMADNLEKYSNTIKLDKKEFQELFTDLFTLKEKIVSSSILNNEIDSLKRSYPEHTTFLDFFKQ